MTKRNKELQTFSETIWKMGLDKKIKAHEWAGILFELQMNVLRPFLERRFEVSYRISK